MRSNLMRLATLFLGVVLGVLGGCTGTDVITVDTGTLQVEIQVVNFDQTRYDSGGLNLAQLKLRPVDPDANAALGGDPLGPVRATVNVDMVAGSASLTTAPLHSGLYTIETVSLSGVRAVDNQPPAGGAPRCIENVVNPGTDLVLGTADDFGELPDARFRLSVGNPFLDIGNLGGATVNVAPGGGQLKVTIDAAVLLRKLEDNFVCAAAPAAGATKNTCAVGAARFPSYACLFLFNEANFESTGAEFLSFD